MLHRHVVVIDTQIGSGAFADINRALEQHLDGWERPLAGELASAFVYRKAPTRLDSRALGTHGRLIGLDFNPSAQDISRLFSQTWGAYLAVSVDLAERRVIALRDPTGRIACWRLKLDGADVLFSHYQDVHRLQTVQAPVNWAFVAHQLTGDFLTGEATGLAGVTELLPGEALTYTNGVAHKKMWWWPHQKVSPPAEDIASALALARHAAETAVDHWADRYDRIGLDLSGGLDSSIVLGLLKARHPDREVIGVNYSFEGQNGDELSFARLAADRYGVKIVQPVLDAKDISLSTPFSRRLMRPNSRILTSGNDAARAEFAQKNCLEAFFTGTGGDHLFASTLPVNAPADYFRSGGDTAGFLATALNIARLTGESVWSVLAQTLRAQLGGRDLRDFDRPANTFLAAENGQDADFGTFMHPWFAAALEQAPAAKLKTIVSLIELQRHHTRYGRSDVGDEVHVLHSQPLLEACLTVPTHWLGLDGMPRGFERSVFADLLPEAIRTRRSKGSSTTFFLEFLGRCLPRLRELLLDGYLANKGLLDRAVVEKALTPVRIAAANDFHALFACVPTELWVRQTESDRASAAASTS